jgi:hypothetical protein
VEDFEGVDACKKYLAKGITSIRMGQKGGVFCPPLTCRHLTKREKNAKKKFYTLSHETHAAEEETSRWSKKEKEKIRRKKEGSRRPWVCETLRWISLEGSPLGLVIVGLRDPRFVCLFFFFFFLPMI